MITEIKGCDLPLEAKYDVVQTDYDWQGKI